MDSSGACFIQLIFFAAIAGIAIAVSYYNNKAIQEAWGRFAMNSGLILSQSGMFSSPRVTGDYKGFDYILHSFSRGSGEKQNYLYWYYYEFPEIH